MAQRLRSPAENLLGPDSEERRRYAEQGIAQLEHVKTHLAKTYGTGEKRDLWKMPSVCRVVFERLAHSYDVLADQTHRDVDRQMAAQYRNDLSLCPPEP